MSSKRKATASSSSSSGVESTKRVKISDDEPLIEGDPELEAAGKRRRGALNTDGYGSDDDVDSDVGDLGEDEDDEVDQREAQRSAARRKREKDDAGAASDDDEDMFALSDNDGKGKGRAKDNDDDDDGKPKAKKFLSLGDIQGQEFGTGDQASDEEDADPELQLEDSASETASSYADDEAAAAERTPPTSPGGTVIRTTRREKGKKSMGFALDGFNMKAEMAQGRIDDEGNYLQNNKDPHAEHDAWLTGVYSRKRIKEAREAKEKREREAHEAESKREAEAMGEDECKHELCRLMQAGETVLEALQRYGAQAKRVKRERKPAPRKRKGDADAAAAMQVDEAPNDKGKGKAKEEEATADPVAQALSQITELSSSLMSRHGLLNIYDETYEGLLRAVRRAGLERADWDPARAAAAAAATSTEEEASAQQQPDLRKFSYRWSPAYLASTGTPVAPDMETFGPYTIEELKEWAASGYFGERGERVLLRAEAGGAWQEWMDVIGA